MPARQCAKVQGFSYIKRQKFRADLCFAQERWKKLTFPLVFHRSSKAKSYSCPTEKNLALIVVFLTDGEARTCAQMLLKLITKKWIYREEDKDCGLTGTKIS